jgi:hypothetical protein
MPYRHNADRRRHIPKMSFKVRNWPAYEAGLRRRSSLTLWVEGAALECWQTIGPSGQARYTDAAIQTTLMLRAAFKSALRQIEGLMTSVLSLMGLTISAPDHTTVSRRAARVAGDPSAVDVAWSVACIDRQHGFASLRSGSVAGDEAWCEVAAGMAKATSGGRCWQRHDCGAGADRSGYGRSVSGSAAAGSD